MDIHIEPDEDCLRIRLRVDGMLQETKIPETSIASALVLRIKLMSNLDISEKACLKMVVSIWIFRAQLLMFVWQRCR